MRLNRNGHSFWALGSSPSAAELSPKSSLTLRSAASRPAADSLVDLPRNSHRDVRANPCCGSLPVCACSGAVPKTYVSSQLANQPLIKSIPPGPTKSIITTRKEKKKTPE